MIKDELFFPPRIRALAEQVENSRFTVIEAPSLAGKSTFLTLLRRRTDLIEISFAAVSHTLDGWWEEFAYAFRRLPYITAMLRETGFPENEGDYLLLEEFFLCLFRRIKKPVRLILEDLPPLHAQDRERLVRFVCFLHERFDETRLRLVVTSEAPVLTGAREKIYSPLKITAADLSFNHEEYPRFVYITGCENSPPELQKKLYKKSKGLNGLLYLYLKYYAGKDRGQNRQRATMTDIIGEVVFRKLSDDEFDAMLMLALPRKFSEKDIPFLIGSKAAFDAALYIYPMVMKLRGDEFYHIHPLIRQFLLDRLRKSQLPVSRKYCMKAGNYLSKRRRLHEAMESFLLNKDYEKLLWAAEQNRTAYLYDAFLSEMLKDCPKKEANANPAGCIAIMASYLRAENPQGVCQMSVPIERYISRKSSNYMKKMQITADYNMLLAEQCPTDLKKTVGHLGTVMENNLTFEPSYIRKRWSEKAGVTLLERLHTHSGTLADNVADFSRLAVRYGAVADTAPQGLVLLSRCEMRYAVCSLQELEQSVAYAEELLLREKQWAPYLSAVFLHCRYLLWRCDFSLIESRLENAAQKLRQEKQFRLFRTLDLMTAYIYIVAGQPHNIPQWIKQGEITLTSPCNRQLAPFANVVFNQYLIASGNYDRFLRRTAECEHVFAQYNSLMGTIYLLVQQAAVYEHLNMPDKMLPLLVKALELCMPDSLVMPFLPNSPVINSALLRLPHGPWSEFSERLSSRLTVFDSYLAPIKQELQPADTRKGLTPAESKVALLAMKRLSAKEIAEKTGVSVVSVRLVLKSVYQKLDIPSSAKNKYLLLREKLT